MFSLTDTLCAFSRSDSLIIILLYGHEHFIAMIYHTSCQ